MCQNIQLVLLIFGFAFSPLAPTLVRSFCFYFYFSNEDEDEGFLISDTGIGMRMKAMEYWKCSETGLTSGSSQDSIRFVLVESLESQGESKTYMLH